MNLTVRIHDKEYKEEVVQGITFSEEYNETLDSGTVRLTHVRGQIKDLKPYDDVYIYDSDYDFDSNIGQWRKGGDLKDNPFYRHLLVDQFSEEIINLSEGIFSYTIELFSETKGLEVVQCPNVSVTQPLNVKKKVDIYTYLVRFTNLYSPKYKTIDKDKAGCWAYTQKYRVAPELEEVFSGFYSQDFTLSNPTLRDILSTLMITKDMIPYVKDNVIYAKDISKRTGTYDIAEEQNTGRVNRIVGQMSSADYCDGVRRQYSDALSQNGTCDFIEYLGFRNKDDALLTLDNLQLEVANKIYRIKKVNMCYYKKSYVVHGGETMSPWYFYKADISCLIKPKNEWDLLSQDWRELDNTLAQITSIEDLSKYRLSTLYYEIGGKTIGGWGQRYNKLATSPLSTWDYTVSVLENILKTVDAMNLSGDVNRELYLKELEEKYGWAIDGISVVPDTVNEMYNATGSDSASLIQKYKTVFFEIEYEGFYDGALVHSRDIGNDNIFQNDNVSSSLTLLEKDGISQKEKLNRFANKTHVINGRLDGVNYDVAKLLQLGATGTIGCDNDVIIYRREYSIYNNYISVSYAGIQDYVLKNFYTSVYAKYRVNQLMSYGESVLRAENKKVFLILSKNKKQKNEENTFFNIVEDNASSSIDIQEFFSAFSQSDSSRYINTVEINQKFLTECYSFSSGNIACFNFQMVDNISAGNYIEKWMSQDYSLLLNHPSDNPEYYIGAKQQWLNVIDDNETGAMAKLSASLFHTDYNNELLSNDPYSVYKYSQNLPSVFSDTKSLIGENKSRKFSFEDLVSKDNKERINYTLQIEPISDTKNIIFSEYFIRLNNLFLHDINKKIESNREIKIGSSSSLPVPIKIVTSHHPLTTPYFQIAIGFEDPSEVLDKYLSVRPQGENGKLPFTTTIELKTATGDIYFHFESSHIYWTIAKDQSGVEQTYRVIEGAGYYKYGNKTHTYTRLWCAYEKFSTYGDVPSDGYWWVNKDAADTTLFPEGTFSNQAQLGIPDVQQEKISILQKNMFLQYSENNITEDIKYQVMTGASFENSLSDKKVSDVFFVESTNDPRLIVDVTDITEVDSNSKIRILNGIKSIRYWYFDFDAAYTKDYSNSNYVYQYTPEKSGYNFVFGINLYPEDIRKNGDKRYVDIYITKTTNRDERVFDGMGRQVGIIHNCVDKEGNYIAPTQQEYDTINEYPEGDITITLQSAMGNHTKQWKCYQSEIIQPNFSIDEKEYKAKHGTSVKYWIDGSGKKHNDGYAMVVNNNETLTFYGEDWWKDLDPSQMWTTELYLSPTHTEDIHVGHPYSLPRTFNITGDIKTYPITVKGAVELTIEYNGKTTSESHNFAIELKEYNEEDASQNIVFSITTEDQDAMSIFSLYYRKYTSDDDYKLVYQLNTGLIGSDYEDKGTLTLKANIGINEIIQPYILQE